MATKKKETAAVGLEEKKAHSYELIFIINPELPEEALEARIDSVNKFISDKGGTVSNTDRWGKRRLAYPINRFLEGVYVLNQFEMSPAWSKELETSLKISEDVLRYMLVRLDG